MSAPNIESVSVPTSTGGNQMGIKVGEFATETVGFYGVDGQAQAATIADVGNSATGTQLATAINAIIDVLEGMGLIAAD